MRWHNACKRFLLPRSACFSAKLCLALLFARSPAKIERSELFDYQRLSSHTLSIESEKESALPGQSVRVERVRAGEGEYTKRQERAHRILDAAAELIQRWGYKKTAVDDIARLAGVAKGTIYLHWKTREDLFAALLLRESVETVEIVLELIAADPLGVYLSHIVKHSMYIIMTRPLARALFVQDIEVLGDLLQSGQEDMSVISQRKFMANRELCILYRERGLLRTDQSLDEQLKIASALVIGCLMMNQYVPPDLHSSPEEIAELMARAIHDALEPAEPVAPEVLREVKAIWDRIAGQMLQLYRERLQRELE